MPAACGLGAVMAADVEPAGWMSKSDTARQPASVLLVVTCWWPTTARFAQLLVQGGCQVAILCPPGHPAKAVPGVRATNLSAFFPLRTIRREIRDRKPHLLIPADERAVLLLHELAASGPAPLRALVERSLGPVSGQDVTSSRPKLLDLAAKLGIAIPPSTVIPSRASLGEWLNRVPGPWVLKIDGSSSGMGVFVVHTREDAFAVVRTLQNRWWRFVVALKRMLVNRDAFWLADWLRRGPPLITAQAYVEGRPADLAMFCWRGAVLAASMAEAVASAGENRPTTMARLIDRPDFMAAATSLAAALQLTGFYGLDFMIEDATGKALLIEMNPRPTPLANPRLDQGRDLIGAAIGALTGQRSTVAGATQASALLAYFPQAWRATPNDPRMASAIQDAPWDEPALLAEMLRPARPDRQWLARLMTRLSRRNDRQLKKIFTTAVDAAEPAAARSGANQPTIHL